MERVLVHFSTCGDRDTAIDLSGSMADIRALSTRPLEGPGEPPQRFRVLLADRPDSRSSGLAGASLSKVQAPSDRKSTRLNSSHITISYAVFCLKKKKKKNKYDH